MTAFKSRAAARADARERADRYGTDWYVRKETTDNPHLLPWVSTPWADPRDPNVATVRPAQYHACRVCAPSGSRKEDRHGGV